MAERFRKLITALLFFTVSLGTSACRAEITALKPGASLYWQLQGKLATQHQTSAYSIDLEEYENNDVIASLRARGITVICYISAGSYEDWRGDKALFAAKDIGKPLGGWPGERWLNVNSAAVRTIMVSRFKRAAKAGCNAIEPDNLDAYQHDSGFSISATQQIDYLHFLAQQAHAHKLSIGLKNAVDLIQKGALAQKFDWALNEECYRYNECDLLLPFVSQNKAVFITRYVDKPVARECKDAKAKRFDLAYYHPDYLLDGKQFLRCSE